VIDSLPKVVLKIVIIVAIVASNFEIVASIFEIVASIFEIVASYAKKLY